MAVVDDVERAPDASFVAHSRDADARGRARVVLATGVVDIEPQLPNLRDAIRQGLVRHCPICDGFEVHGTEGRGDRQRDEGRARGTFIRHFTDTLTLFSLGPAGIPPTSTGSSRPPASISSNRR